VVANFSSDNLSVKVAAPGISVPAQGRDGEYWLVSGTSPACALVAGVAALIKSKYPHLAPTWCQRADLDHHGPADRRLQQPGRLRHRGRGRRPDPGRPAGGRPAGGGQHQGHAKYHGTFAAAPVRPRGSGQLVLFALLALTSLALAAAAATQLILLRRGSR